MSGISLTSFAYQAARDLGCLRAGQTLSTDLLSDIRVAANNMLDSWLLEDLLVLFYPAQIFTLTAGLQAYQIGTGQAAPNFNTTRPNDIELANIILNNVNPVLRVPLDIINKEQWAAIAVQGIPSALPLKLYYDKGWNQSQYGTINIWPGPLQNYQIELYNSDQSVLAAFPDNTTTFLYPPGYAKLIQKNLAVEIAPLMTMYCKSARTENVMAPSQAMLALVQKQADDARQTVEISNAPDPILTGDPAFLGNSARRGWNYLLGINGRTGR